jgi:hypothetical protein
MFAVGLKARLEIPSCSAGVICTSLLGFKVAAGAAAADPNMLLLKLLL